MSLFQYCVPCLSRNYLRHSSSRSHSQVAPVRSRNHSKLLLRPARCLLQKLDHWCTCQEVYSPLADTGHSLTLLQQQPQTKRLVQQTAAPSHPVHRSPPPINHAVQSDIHRDGAADFRSLDEFTFVYSFAKDLPNIFGNLEDDV